MDKVKRTVYVTAKPAEGIVYDFSDEPVEGGVEVVVDEDFLEAFDEACEQYEDVQMDLAGMAFIDLQDDTDI